MAPTRRRVLFFGRVQGVGFRYFCLDAAQRRAVRGWVCNRPDQSVEMEAEAEESVLDEFVRHLAESHPYARVDRVDSTPLSPRADLAEGFSIRH
jgi:acylphosphatase